MAGLVPAIHAETSRISAKEEGGLRFQLRMLHRRRVDARAKRGHDGDKRELVFPISPVPIGGRVMRQARGSLVLLKGGKDGL
ncbi:hypothetical protein D1O30_18445 [Methylocystis hirsuta]|uniref:Uncharacterized protein n=1 Tax=Methylocystis hirsuta TaxID=369798 RepID=A0A3M9XSK6_9HYPH|nr:hypothetical protein D1O30_18445 [Methylocystis hirsuta]